MDTKDYFIRVQRETPTQFFCDSATHSRLERAVKWGAVGATCNPPRVARAVRFDADHWNKAVKQILGDCPELPDENIADILTQKVVKRASELLLPLYKRSKGELGYQAIQGSPRKYADLDVLISSAISYSRIAPNIAVKIPMHKEGLIAIQELAAQGINIIATTGYSVSQSLAAAEAHVRGLRQQKNQANRSKCIIAMIVGRLDAHFSDSLLEENSTLSQEITDHAGIIVTKKIYRLLQERRLPAYLLAAGGRRTQHFTDFVGGKMAITLAPEMQEELIKEDFPVVSRMDDYPPDEITDELRGKVPDFNRAFDEDGLRVEEMRDFGPCVKLENYFNEGYSDLLDFIDSCR